MNSDKESGTLHVTAGTADKMLEHEEQLLQAGYQQVTQSAELGPMKYIKRAEYVGELRTLQLCWHEPGGRR